MMTALKLLWDFSRPHTIIGSWLSITTLYLLASTDTGWQTHLGLYAWALISALACNICITGLNQLVDVEMDKVNKPFLPIAAGRLSIERARWIVWISGVVSLLAAIMVSRLFLGLIILITVIGYLYSAPPIRLKRHHLPASLCIVVVRGVLVNLGIGLAFELAVNGRVRADHVLVPLTIFMSAFSLAIAWFKDLYDVEGDLQHKVKTLAVLYSIKTAYWTGGMIVLLAYAYGLWFSYARIDSQWLLITHAVLGAAFVVHLMRSDTSTRAGIYRFYMVFWVFFFAEYGVYIGYALS